MTKVNYQLSDGSEQSIEAANGDSLMFTAVQHGVSGIVGECGGVLSCATCHVYVDPAWVDRVRVPSEDELDMLEATAAERRRESRLSCQIQITPELEGLVVQIPGQQ